MDSTQIIVSAITVVGVAMSSGIIQFFVNRRDKNKEAARAKEYEALRQEFITGLEERERTGKYRYDEHQDAIKLIGENHQKDFQELKEAIQQLTDNDSKITESLQHMSDKQSIMADSLVGIAHSRILQYTDRISERGAITNKEKATLKSMYVPYHGLGGNGEVQEAFEYVLTLPVVSEDTARDKDKALRCAEIKEYCSIL